MSYLVQGRIVGRLDGIIEATDSPKGDWQSPYASPTGLSALMLEVLEGRVSRAMPVAWVTPQVFVGPPFEFEPLGSGQFQIMAGVRTVILRASAIPQAAEGLFEGGGEIAWGVRVHLLKGVRRARFVYWQYE